MLTLLEETLADVCFIRHPLVAITVTQPRLTIARLHEYVDALAEQDPDIWHIRDVAGYPPL